MAQHESVLQGKEELRTAYCTTSHYTEEDKTCLCRLARAIISAAFAAVVNLPVRLAARGPAIMIRVRSTVSKWCVTFSLNSVYNSTIRAIVGYKKHAFFPRWNAPACLFSPGNRHGVVHHDLAELVPLEGVESVLT